ncbi:hypothetical protein [Streptomyces sp. NPDC056255]|uniref:hypothetical protein n=1 Tax=Streptomyces sp. NPDC056255 TaxID=3345764 RepID=UPI0035E3210B
MDAAGVMGRTHRLGTDAIGPGLRAPAERHSCVGEVCGLDVFRALQPVRDRKPPR